MEVDKVRAVGVAALTLPGDEFVAFKFEGGGLSVGGFLVVLDGVSAAGGGDVGGEVDAQSPAGDVEEVYAVVAQFAVVPVPEPVPVVVDSVVEQGSAGSGALPEIVVAGGGDFGGFSDADGRAFGGESGAGGLDFTDFSAFQEIDGFANAGAAAALGADLDGAFVFTGGFDHEFGFAGIVAAGFFAVDVFSCGTGGDGGGGVLVVGGSAD